VPTIRATDDLDVFYPLIGELELTNIAAAFEGGTAVRNLVSAVPWVTESAEVVMKAGCGLDMLPVLGERQDAPLLRHRPSCPTIPSMFDR
jgi:hypothetical protein